MWFWTFVVVDTAVVLVGAVFQDLFWWSMIVTGVLWTVAVVVECVWSYRQEQALARRRESVSPPRASAAIAANELAPSPGGVGSTT